jgi:hypothetical protein
VEDVVDLSLDLVNSSRHVDCGWWFGWLLVVVRKVVVVLCLSCNEEADGESQQLLIYSNGGRCLTPLYVMPTISAVAAQTEVVPGSLFYHCSCLSSTRPGQNGKITTGVLTSFMLKQAFQTVSETSSPRPHLGSSPRSQADSKAWHFLSVL